MITSAPSAELGDVTISNLAAAGLPVVSTLRASKVATLAASRIVRVTERLSGANQNLARRAPDLRVL